MSETNLVVGLLGGFSLALAGGILWGVTRMAADGEMGANPVAGIRTAATTASPEAWVAGHRAALPWARWLGVLGLVGGVVLVACGFLDVTDPEAPHPMTMGVFAVGFGGVLLGCIPLVRVANRAARQHG